MKSPADALEVFLSAFDTAKIRFALGGSRASTAFGEPRLTNGIDILAEFTEENVDRFLRDLPATFYADRDEARQAIRRGRPST